ncbi:hypothetical protein Pint_02659 [Pistacia integerrima]|uniref:Uncharacterized protein n=1 Tax=Pistacia integerrima TaxID=434235 RepID=A0ACC0ZNL3_9ROSI|nr:hypothetical protein Pint_02659 [Pistacia integerrima]
MIPTIERAVSGVRKFKRYTNSTPQNHAAVTDTHHNPSSPRRTRGRARWTLTEDDNNDRNVNNSNSNIGHLASPERSRQGDANEITILPPRWDSVAVKARKRQYSSSSSGYIVGGRRVLTNAHSVERHTQVKLKMCGSDTKYLATVLSIGTESMLTVNDDEFWEGVSPVKLEIYQLFKMLSLLWDTYAHGSTELLGMQHLSYLPYFWILTVLRTFQFLNSMVMSNVLVFPILGVEWQKMEIPDLGMTMGMRRDQKGVRVRRIEPTAPESQVLKPSDIIISFDGIDIANDGTGDGDDGHMFMEAHIVQLFLPDCCPEGS